MRISDWRSDVCSSDLVSVILVRACLLEQILQKREVPCGQSATGRSGHGKPPSRPNTGSGALKVGSIVLEDRPLARPRGSRTPGQGLSACDEVHRAALRAIMEREQCTVARLREWKSVVWGKRLSER